jgi:hypothetical protein
VQPTLQHEIVPQQREISNDIAEIQRQAAEAAQRSSEALCKRVVVRLALCRICVKADVDLKPLLQPKRWLKPKRSWRACLR